MIIREFLPNPVGKDTEGEYITLLNIAKEEIDLTNWHIKDESGKIFKLSGIKLGAGEEIRLEYRKTKITLNNNGETIYLINPEGEIKDELSYIGSAIEGRIITNSEIGIDEELKAQLLENFPPSPPVLNKISTSHLLLSIMVSGVIFAVLGVWILKNLINKTEI